MMEDKLDGEIITKFISLHSKMYFCKKYNDEKVKRVKGTKNV